MPPRRGGQVPCTTSEYDRPTAEYVCMEVEKPANVENVEKGEMEVMVVEVGCRASGIASVSVDRLFINTFFNNEFGHMCEVCERL